MNTTFTIILFAASAMMLAADLRSGRIHYTRKYKNYIYAWTGRIKISRGSKSYSIWRRHMPFWYWTKIGYTALSTLALLPAYFYYDRIMEWVSDELYTPMLILLYAPWIVTIAYLGNGLFGRLSLWNRRRWREANAPTKSEVQTLGLSDPPVEAEQLGEKVAGNPLEWTKSRVE